MPSPHTIERQRGAKEASQQLGVLRERWPLAFPVRAQDVRPLAMRTVGQIAEAMGWKIPYTIGVLTYWKMAAVYCQAVLAHDQRISIDGTPAEPVDADAKELATKQLAKLAARNAVLRPGFETPG
jgi:sRNA-binding protein